MVKNKKKMHIHYSSKFLNNGSRDEGQRGGEGGDDRNLHLVEEFGPVTALKYL